MAVAHSQYREAGAARIVGHPGATFSRAIRRRFARVQVAS